MIFKLSFYILIKITLKGSDPVKNVPNITILATQNVRISCPVSITLKG